jgi:DMSO reductase family type II enzyme chaperone
MAVNKLDQSYARATVYRFLSLAFAYPVGPVHEDLIALSGAIEMAAGALSTELLAPGKRAVEEIRARERRQLGTEYRDLFTHSASPDCPLNECAYGARHIYQEVQELADIAGFYNAFGVELRGDRPDSLSAELEFGYLLALKEAVALEKRDRSSARTCRDARKKFIHDHLGRWAENIGRRIEALAPDSAYAAAGQLLRSFVADEIAALRVAGIVPYQEVPNPPEPLDDEGCPAEEGVGVTATQLMQEEDFLGEIREVAARKS